MPIPFLCGAEDGEVGIEPQLVVDLVFHPLDIGRRQVDLVDHGDDDEIVLHGGVEVGECLRLHALGRVHEKEHAFARGEGPGYFVGEIDVSRGIDEVELEFLAAFTHIRAD